MKYEVYPVKINDEQVSDMLIYPREYKYDNKNFFWASSVCETLGDEIVLPRLSEYDEFFTIIAGSAVVSCNNSTVKKLSQHESSQFDRADNLKVWGECKYHSLITRKGCFTDTEIIKLNSHSQNIDFRGTENQDKKFIGKSYIFVCLDDYCIINIDDNSVMLKADEQIAVYCSSNENPHISAMGEGYLLKAEIHYEYQDGDLGPINIPEEPATFEDFKECIYLANSQFRGAKFIFKRKKTEWLDEALTDKINPLESAGVNIIIFIVIASILALIVHKTFSIYGLLILELIWFIIHCLVVAPLVYFVMLPKPIKKHIKKIDNLTPYERRLYEFEKKYYTRKSARIIQKYNLDEDSKKDLKNKS